MKGLSVNLDTLIKTLINNFRLDPHVAAVAKVIIDESGVVDFSGLIREVLGSKKFDFLSKLQDGIDKCKVVVELDEIDNIKVLSFSDSLYAKLTWYFDELSFLSPTKEQLDRQIWKNHQYDGKEMINEKESIVCDMIGDTFEIYRLVTMNKPMLQERIKEIVYQLSINKKKSLLAIPMDKKSDGENRILELVKKMN